MLDEFRNIHKGQRIFIIGKGPSLRTFQPFDALEGQTCIGVNNVYTYFPHCSYVVMWHGEIYWADEDYLAQQKDFRLVYSSFHNLPPDLPNATDVPYAGEHPLPDVPEGYLSYWREHPQKWMYKSTYATAVKLAWWMGAKRITLIGFDFSLKDGRTADDTTLHIPVKLRMYTVDEILARQAAAFEHLKGQLLEDGVTLERVMSPSELTFAE